MIAFIRGKIVSCNVDSIVVDQNGLGWEIGYAHTDRVHLNEDVTIFTYMHLSENDVRIFGFESADEKALFMKLISVKGLGPKTAINMLAKAGYQEIIAAVEEGNVTFLKSMPGIGNKAASQIVLDLKGKLVAADSSSASVKYTQEITDACDGLKNLGYKQGEISKAAKYMSEQPGKTTGEYLRMGLQFLMKTK